MSHLNYRKGSYESTIAIKRVKIVDRDGNASKKSVASPQLKEEDPTSDTFHLPRFLPLHASIPLPEIMLAPRSGRPETLERICIAAIWASLRTGNVCSAINTEVCTTRAAHVGCQLSSKRVQSTGERASGATLPASCLRSDRLINAATPRARARARYMRHGDVGCQQ